MGKLDIYDKVQLMGNLLSTISMVEENKVSIRDDAEKFADVEDSLFKFEAPLVKWVSDNFDWQLIEYNIGYLSEEEYFISSGVAINQNGEYKSFDLSEFLSDKAEDIVDLFLEINSVLDIAMDEITVQIGTRSDISYLIREVVDGEVCCVTALSKEWGKEVDSEKYFDDIYGVGSMDELESVISRAYMLIEE